MANDTDTDMTEDERNARTETCDFILDRAAEIYALNPTDNPLDAVAEAIAIAAAIISMSLGEDMVAVADHLTAAVSERIQERAAATNS